MYSYCCIWAKIKSVIVALNLNKCESWRWLCSDESSRILTSVFHSQKVSFDLSHAILLRRSQALIAFNGDWTASVGTLSDGTATEQRGGSIATVLTCRVFHPLFSHTSCVKQLYTKLLTINGFRTCTFCLTAAILVMINTSARTNCENWDQFGATNLSLHKVSPLFFFLAHSSDA